MSKNINRRAFITRSALGVGAASLTSLGLPFTGISNLNSRTSRQKKLIATTDYTVNISRYHNGSRYGTPIQRSEEYYANHACFLDRKQLDEMHRVLASMGVTRHQWIVDNYWTLYEDYPHGFNLLEEAAKAAHNQGIEFIAEIKLFEGGGFGRVLPQTLPVPIGTAAKDLRGIFPIVHPFVADNPHMCLKCKPGKYEYKSPLRKIRLVKSDDKPTRIKAEHLTIFTSETNNRFVPYNGKVNFRESVESRFMFPLWKDCRVLHLEELEIPSSHKYILVKCSLYDEQADFGNEMGCILELEGVDGNLIQHYQGEGPISLNSHYNGFYHSKVLSELLRYLKSPELISEIEDENKMREHYKDFYSFDRYKLTDWKALDKDGYIVAALGKPEYLLGNLHPIYPEVRKYWLDLTRFCLDTGADGINYRIANHSKLPEKWDYGFNDAAIQAANGKMDYVSISRVNGDAYTNFLFEARELIKGRNKIFIHHLHARMLKADDRGRLSSLPPNFEWQWERWVNEIADEFELRGGFMLRPWNLTEVLDAFSNVTKKVNKPFYYQGDFHGMTFNGPFNITKEEIELVKEHPGLDGLVLYETANYTIIDDNGNVIGSPKYNKIIKEHFFE